MLKPSLCFLLGFWGVVLSAHSSLTPQKVRVKKQWVRAAFTKDGPLTGVLQPLRPVYVPGSKLSQTGLVVQGNKINGLQAYSTLKGRKKWQVNIKGGLAGDVLLAGMRLFFAGADGFVYSLSASTGQVYWKQYIGSSVMSRPVLRKNNLYIAKPDKLYCLNARTGGELWSYSHRLKKSDFIVEGVSAPLAQGGFIYFKTSGGTLIALNYQGRRRWIKRLSRPEDRFTSALSAPVMGKVCLYSAGFESGLYCLNKKTGRTIWKTAAGSHGSAVLAGSRLFYPTSQGHVLALDQKSGEIIWKHKVKRSIAGDLALYKNTVVYGEFAGGLKFLSQKTGREMGSFFFGRGLSAQPLVRSASAALYFMSNYGWLYKLKIL